MIDADAEPDLVARIGRKSAKRARGPTLGYPGLESRPSATPKAADHSLAVVNHPDLPSRPMGRSPDGANRKSPTVPSQPDDSGRTPGGVSVLPEILIQGLDRTAVRA
jgi:hypothetical protein